MTFTITLALAATQIDAGAAPAEPSCPAVVLSAPPARPVTLMASDLSDRRGPRLELQLGSSAEEVLGFGALKLVRLSGKRYAGGVLGRRVDELDQHRFTLSFEHEQLSLLTSATDVELVSETGEILRFPVTPADAAPMKDCLTANAVPGSPTIDPLTRRSFTFVPQEPNQPLRLRQRRDPSFYYPVKAMQEGRQGTSRVALTIGESGRITECTVVVSSGHADLDAASCRVARSSVFLPETNAAGEPVAVKREQMLQWKLGE